MEENDAHNAEDAKEGSSAVQGRNQVVVLALRDSTTQNHRARRSSRGTSAYVSPKTPLGRDCFALLRKADWESQRDSVLQPRVGEGLPEAGRRATLDPRRRRPFAWSTPKGLRLSFAAKPEQANMPEPLPGLQPGKWTQPLRGSGKFRDLLRQPRVARKASQSAVRRTGRRNPFGMQNLRHGLN